MSDLLVIGALAWDRPIRLSGPLGPGARLVGRTLDGKLGGRLGGGGANAAVALAGAGRSVALAAMIAQDAVADAALAALESSGVDTRLVRRREGDSKTTMILIDPAGERMVLGLDWAPARAPDLPGPADCPELRPRGLFIRSALPGAAAWTHACVGPVVAHWPSPELAGRVDVMVASADDLDAPALRDPLGTARAAHGDGVSWVVVTAFGAQATLSVCAPRATVVDATGAGDVFAAGLLDALSAGAAMDAALNHACAWGAAAVELDSSAPLGAASGTFRAFAAP